MTKDEAKKRALTAIWGWASYLHEGHEKGELSDHWASEVHMGFVTEEEAFMIQAECFHEAEIIHRKSIRQRKSKWHEPLK